MVQKVNCCKAEQMGTKEIGKMMNRIQTLEEGRVPAKEAKNWTIEGEKKIITRKEYERLLYNFEMGGLMAQQGLWNLAKEKIMNERGELPNEVGDAVREYRAMHEENFWSKMREVKRRERRELRRRKKKGVKRGKEKMRKKRTNRERSKKM